VESFERVLNGAVERLGVARHRLQVTRTAARMLASWRAGGPWPASKRWIKAAPRTDACRLRGPEYVNSTNDHASAPGAFGESLPRGFRDLLAPGATATRRGTRLFVQALGEDPGPNCSPLRRSRSRRASMRRDTTRPLKERRRTLTVVVKIQAGRRAFAAGVAARPKILRRLDQAVEMPSWGRRLSAQDVVTTSPKPWPRAELPLEAKRGRMVPIARLAVWAKSTSGCRRVLGLHPERRVCDHGAVHGIARTKPRPPASRVAAPSGQGAAVTAVEGGLKTRPGPRECTLGNCYVDDEARIVLRLGIMGRIDPRTRRLLREAGVPCW